MKRLTARRYRNVVILIVLVAGFVFLDSLLRSTLNNAAIASGWSLLAMALFLALYNTVKKIPYFPLGASSTWLQLHIYIGLVAVVVFVLHIGMRVPNGTLESILAALFVLVAASGMLGLAISRIFARRLTVRGGEILFDRIPRKLGRLRRAAERVVQRCLVDSESSILPEFYVSRLEPFFTTYRDFSHHLMNSSRPQKALVAEIEAQRRYTSDAEAEYFAQVADLVVQKHDLDYQFAHQVTLRYWLFVHVPLTYALLVFAALHVALVYSFTGSHQ